MRAGMATRRRTRILLLLWVAARVMVVVVLFLGVVCMVGFMWLVFLRLGSKKGGFCVDVRDFKGLVSGVS